MRRVCQMAGLVCLVFSLWVVWQAGQMEYFTPIGPGAGFFPLWLGILLVGLSVAWVVQVTMQPEEPMAADFIPDRGGTFRILSILAAIAAFALLVDTMGFQVTMFAFLLFLLRSLGRQNLALTVALSLAGSGGVYYAFVHWLDVPLPASSLQFLSAVGL